MVPKKSRNLVLCVLLFLGALTASADCLALPSGSSSDHGAVPSLHQRGGGYVTEGDPDHYETKSTAKSAVVPGLEQVGRGAAGRASFRTWIEEFFHILAIRFGNAARLGV